MVKTISKVWEQIMKTKNNTQRSKYAKAKTPEMVRKQRAAIISYYVKKRKETKKK